MGKCKRLLTVVLAAVLCCTTLPLTAFAGGGPEDGSDKVLEYWSQGTPSPQPTTPADPQQTGQPVPGTQQTPTQGEPLSPGSEFSTREICSTIRTPTSSSSRWRAGTGTPFTS